MRYFFVFLFLFLYLTVYTLIHSTTVALLYLHEHTYIHTRTYEASYIFEGKATRLAELALIFIPIYNVAVSDTSHSKL